MSEWQEIKTCPKDGSDFLVRYKSHHVAHVYMTAPEPPLVQTFRHCGGLMSGQQAGWPEQWMPVPR